MLLAESPYVRVYTDFSTTISGFSGSRFGIFGSFSGFFTLNFGIFQGPLATCSYSFLTRCHIQGHQIHLGSSLLNFSRQLNLYNSVEFPVKITTGYINSANLSMQSLRNNPFHLLLIDQATSFTQVRVVK